MKKFIAAALCAGLLINSGIYATPALAAENSRYIGSTIPADNAYIPGGTRFKVRFTKNISSDKIYKGEPVPIVTAQNIIVNGVVVIPAGTKVKGFFTTAREAGYVGRAGKIGFTVESVAALNGVEIPLHCVETVRGNNDVAGSIAVMLLLSPLGGFFMKGRNARIPKGMQFEVEVPFDSDLEASLYFLAEDMNAWQPHGVSVKLK